MDLNLAIRYGQLVNAAYAINSTDLTNKAGQIVTAGLGTASASYEVITSLYANDLATEINPLRATSQVSIGLVFQSTTIGDAVIAIRGTEGILEWLHDGNFLMVPCPFLSGAGNTEDGFAEMYNSLAIGTAANSPRLTKALATLPWKRPVTSLTICGHSLGGSLATLLALDVAANTPLPFKIPFVYTYASPRTGDPQFANTYNHVVPNTFRIANRLDLVPKLPLPPLYDHVLGLFDLNPVVVAFPLKFLVKPDIPCLHDILTYLFLLSRLAGGPVLPLAAASTP
jgi:hypothetical protein